MGSRKMTAVAVVVAVVVSAEVAVVAGNYSIATGGINAVADQMRGDTAQASCRVAQTAQETQEVVENWAGWAKEKVQDGLRLSVNQSAGTSGVGQQIAEKTRKGKEKAYQTMNDATQKASEKVQKAKEVICESAKEAMGKTQEQAQVHLQAAAQEAQEEGGQAQAQAQAQAQGQVQHQMTNEDKEEGTTLTQAEANATMEDEEDGAQTEAQAQAQEYLTWANGGYNAAKRKATDSLNNARKKISFAGTSHRGEL